MPDGILFFALSGICFMADKNFSRNLRKGLTTWGQCGVYVLYCLYQIKKGRYKKNESISCVRRKSNSLQGF